MNENSPQHPLFPSTQAMQLRQQENKDVISLSVGEPDFDPPLCVAAALQHAVDNKMTKFPNPRLFIYNQ